MNRIFKIIYNRARDLYMVGSENLRTHAGKTGVAVAAIALCSSAFAADPFEYTGSRWYGMRYWQDTDQKYSSVDILLNTNEDDLAGIVLGSTRLDVTDKNSPSVVTVNGLSSPTVMRGISLFDDGSGSASISFAGNLGVHLDGKADSAYGIAFWDGSRGEFSATGITVTGQGNQASGLLLDNSFASFSGDFTVDASGYSDMNIGVDLLGGQAVFKGIADITAKGGEHAWGVIGDDASVVQADDMNVHVSEAAVQGLGIHLSRNSQLTAHDIQIMVNSAAPAGIAVTDGSSLDANSAIVSVTDTTATGQGADGFAVSEQGSTVTLKRVQVTVAGNGDEQNGFRVSTGGTLNIEESAIVKAKTAATVDLGTLTIQKDFYAHFLEESRLHAESDGKIAINEAGEGTVQFKGYSDLTPSSGNRILVNLAGPASYWDVTRDSRLTDLHLSGGTLNMSHISGFQTVTTHDLGGNNGLVKADTDFSTGETDKLVITGTASGQHGILVASSGTATVGETQYIVSDASGNATFSLANPGGKVDAGVYLYELSSRNAAEGATEWYLTRATGKDNTPELTPTAEAVLAMAASGAQNALYQNNLTDLRKRLGEVRDGARDGLWASFSGWQDVLSGYVSTRFRQEVYSLSLGLDHAIDDHWLVGAGFRATVADQKTHGHEGYHATGDADSQGFNLYATWTHANGSYADFVATVDRYGQKISTNMLDGQETKGKYHNWGFGLSAEVGRKFAGLGHDRTWFVEPQVQLSWYHVNGDSFHMDNGMRVKQDDADTLTGRLGLVAGRDLEQEGNRKGQYYLKAGINHELSGEQKIALNETPFEEDRMMGTRFYYGAGLDWELDKTTKVYGQIEREDGGRYTKEFEFRLGLKRSF